nr:MAG TPA: Talin-1 [Caudoviricetes sp.]
MNISVKFPKYSQTNPIYKQADGVCFLQEITIVFVNHRSHNNVLILLSL